MPEKFMACVKGGGRVRTIMVGKDGKYMHVCYPPGGGSPVHGEIKMKKEMNVSESDKVK
jgi:hypothetical protein